MFPELTAFIRETMSIHPILVNLCILGVAILGGLLVNLITRHVVLYVMKVIFQKLPIDIPEGKNLLVQIATRLACVTPIAVVYILLVIMDIELDYLLRMRKVCIALSVICIVGALLSFLNLLALWYRKQPDSQNRSIKGVVQLIQIFIVLGAFIMVVSMLVNKSPVMLLSGLGAVAAVLLLLLQHTIHSFVASVEINADHLVEIGDWIVMETEDFEDIDGIVTDISLHTVKVRNWDRTQVCLPISFMVSKPFVNYTAMERGGGRRIQKAFLIDQRTIRFLSNEEVEILKGFDLLKDYLEDRQARISEYNSTHSGFNTRHLTNLGVFRIYAQRYLEQNPDIRADLTLFVRALSPSDSGVPLEIYCFTKEVQWVPFERVQSKIMEHLLAVLPSFGLRVFQRSSDIHQEGRYQIDVVGGAFPFERGKSLADSGPKQD